MATDNTWEQQWAARLAALQAVFGPADDQVFHATVPFEFGTDAGGAADVVRFRRWCDGVLYVTADLIGCDGQIATSLGPYELAIAHRTDTQWGANLISRLAHYTLEAALEPDETMSIDGAVPEGSAVSALLFTRVADLEVQGVSAGVLLCVGITGVELGYAHEHEPGSLLARLKEAGVYPFTDLSRESVI